MKGQSLLQWTFISLSVTAILAIFAFLQLDSILTQRAEMTAMYQAEETSSIINLLQASPTQTSYTFTPSLCVDIGQDIRMSIKDIEYVTALLNTELNITVNGGESGTICKVSEFKKTNDKIDINQIGD